MSEKQTTPGCWYRSRETREALSKGCAKGLLITLNFCCILLAVWIFCCGVVDSRFLTQYAKDPMAHWLFGELIKVSTCLLLMFCAVVGCVGAITERLYVLFMYAMFVLTMIVVKLLVVILVAVRRSSLQYRASAWLQQHFFFSTKPTDQELIDSKRFWDTLQSTYECCGVYGPADYLGDGRPVSVSCCDTAYRARNSTAQSILYATCIDSVTYYVTGCEVKILHVLQKAPEHFFNAVIFSFFLEFMGIPLAIWLAHYIRKSGKFYKNSVSY